MMAIYGKCDECGSDTCDYVCSACQRREIEQLQETNRRLNRRCQEVESAIKQKRYWSMAYEAGLKDQSEDRRWQRIAQKHGEKNARLQKANKELQAKVDRLQAAEAAREAIHAKDG